jgi:orotate phosphoribosyltransferase
MNDIEFLRKRILKKALKRGTFKLASGGTSPYYFDGKEITLDAQGSAALARVILTWVKKDRAQAIGGLTLGADPIVGSVIALAGQRGLKLKGFIVRKEPKKHGTQRSIEGALKPGSRVIIIDDVVTKGSSTFRAIEEVEKLKCRVTRTAALVDREEGGGEELIRRGYRFTPVFRLKELL